MNTHDDASIDMPDVHEALLDREAYEQVLDDIAAETDILDVLAKGAPRRRAPEEDIGLRRARDLFEAGDIRAFQIRYRWEGLEWRDTVMRTPEGVKIVRISHDWDEHEK